MTTYGFLSYILNQFILYVRVSNVDDYCDHLNTTFKYALQLAWKYFPNPSIWYFSRLSEWVNFYSIRTAVYMERKLIVQVPIISVVNLVYQLTLLPAGMRSSCKRSWGQVSKQSIGVYAYSNKIDIHMLWLFEPNVSFMGELHRRRLAGSNLCSL